MEIKVEKNSEVKIGNGFVTEWEAVAKIDGREISHIAQTRLESVESLVEGLRQMGFN